MSYLSPVLEIGGKRGSDFEIIGDGNGATLLRIRLWIADFQIKAIRVWLTDDRTMQFGNPDGKFTNDFIFEDGEHFSSLTLWKNKTGTHLAAIKFKTSHSREFFAHIKEWEQTEEFPVDTGSGICVGISGRAGADINSLGFLFFNSVKSTVLKDVKYDSLGEVKPSVSATTVKSVTYTNYSTLTEEQKIETSETLIRKSSWSMNNKMQFNFIMEVEAEVPEVVEESAGYSFILGNKSSHGLEFTDEKPELLSFPVQVPPGKSMDVDITIDQVAIDVPYTGTVQITCENGSVLEFQTEGIYKGLTYTNAKTVVKSQNIHPSEQDTKLQTSMDILPVLRQTACY